MLLQMCGSSSWIIPAGLSLPYAWRLCQCIRTWSDTGNKSQLLNALKYSTAFPVIILSAVNFQVTDERWNQFWKPLWLLAAFLNSAYSYYWDIERDWEIQYFSSAQGEPETWHQGNKADVDDVKHVLRIATGAWTASIPSTSAACWVLIFLTLVFLLPWHH